jgi:hypothetical protein
MKPLRRFFHRLKGSFERNSQSHPRPKPSNVPRVDFSYTVYWTKQVRQWDAERRAAIRQALLQTLGQPGFEPNAYERRYTVAGLDPEGQAHSGASLIALKKVLTAFSGEENNPTGVANGPAT